MQPVIPQAIIPTTATTSAHEEIRATPPPASLFPAFSFDIIKKQLLPAVNASNSSYQAQVSAQVARLQQIETFHSFPNSKVPLVRFETSSNVLTDGEIQVRRDYAAASGVQRRKEHGQAKKKKKPAARVPAFCSSSLFSLTFSYFFIFFILFLFYLLYL